MTTLNQGDKNFEGLLGVYLRRQHQVRKNSNPDQPHLDEDTLSAFVEGALTETQTAPILNHLINCSFCRRVSAQLARLSLAFDEAAPEVNSAKTNNWSKLWNNLTESVFRPFDHAVVAHEEALDEEPDNESDEK